MKPMPIPTKATFVSRGFRVIVAVAILCAVPLAATLKAQDNQAGDVFYTTSFSSTGSPVPEVWAIQVKGSVVTKKDIGSTIVSGCGPLALSPSGTLYSMCGDITPSTGIQNLAVIDQKTGQASVFGMNVVGLSVMAMDFGSDGTLYAVGDWTPSDANYNSLYTVNVTTGVLSRVGSTGAPQFFMDLAFDRDGTLFGVTTGDCTTQPAVLYRIDPTSGKATVPGVNLVGSNCLMGLAFGTNGKLYANDLVLNPGLYLIDIKTGFETAVAALPFTFANTLELVNPR